jgi:hypothetical protein
MQLDLISQSDGTIQALRTISDALWADPKSQAQILAWVKARGFDYLVYPSSVLTDSPMTTLSQVQGWILSSYDSAWGKGPVVAPTSAGSDVTGALVGAAAVGALVWFFTR